MEGVLEALQREEEGREGGRREIHKSHLEAPSNTHHTLTHTNTRLQTERLCTLSLKSPEARLSQHTHMYTVTYYLSNDL